MARPITEWVDVDGDVSIIARETGEVWFYRPDAKDKGADPFGTPMTGRGSAATAVSLLDGAIHLGFRRIETTLATPSPTIAGYVMALIGAYHTSVDTAKNLRRAGRRFQELGRPDVTAYLEERAREETGHDRLALKDLGALGVPAERLVANLVPEGIAPMCRHFDELCAEDYPIGCVGYSYCLERIAALKQAADIESVKAICPEGVDATRFLRSHSGLGSEAAHVEETIAFVAALPADDRIKVVRETYQSAVIMAKGYNRELMRTEAEVIAILERAAGEPLGFDTGRPLMQAGSRPAV
ncbi:hypothetical protein [Pseudorhodoplanes sp.]|uniref:hypothetical protein n=1 Tax=Pseudorhodoplanes sp. TaxID=1934341 RepID=UPI00391ACA6F